MLTSADVVIVGGGPIGLAQAWGIKKLNPSLNVVVLEKYEEYQRKHTLVMQYQQLERLMQATGTESDQTLCALLARLKADPHIRTNELESTFKQFVINSGVEIAIEEVVEKESADAVPAVIGERAIDKQLLRFNPSLIIGADGTHSIVNRCYFPKENQIKHEFDYVLQLRYEINGKEQAEDISTTAFYRSR